MQKKLTSLASLVETEKLPCTKALKLLAEIQVSTKRTKYNGCAIVFVLSQNVFFFSPFLFPLFSCPSFLPTQTPCSFFYPFLSSTFSFFSLFFVLSSSREYQSRSKHYPTMDHTTVPLRRKLKVKERLSLPC